jgi:hypothetical protein
MKLTITQTEQIIDYCGVPCRMWRGTTEKGTQIYAFIPFIGILAGQDMSEMDELMEVPAPPQADALLQKTEQ